MRNFRYARARNDNPAFVNLEHLGPDSETFCATHTAKGKTFIDVCTPEGFTAHSSV